MQNIKTLAELPRGRHGVVQKLNSTGSIRRRLQDIGLIPGTAVTCIQISPLGDPAAFLIRGAVIALRKEDASCVILEKGGD